MAFAAVESDAVLVDCVAPFASATASFVSATPCFAVCAAPFSL